MSDDATRNQDFATWIGRTRSVQDDITAFPLNALAGTLGRAEFGACEGAPVPPLWHWLYLMFNAHRIHYDQPYATGQERYPALLVQGPLLAVLLLDLLQREAPRAALRSLEFKAVRPAFGDRPLHLRGRPDGRSVHLWAADDEGRTTMTAKAELEP